MVAHRNVSTAPFIDVCSHPGSATPLARAWSSSCTSCHTVGTARRRATHGCHDEFDESPPEVLTVP